MSKYKLGCFGRTCVGPDGNEIPTPEAIVAELNRLSSLLAECERAGFVKEGKCLKVLGTLPVTADDCVVGAVNKTDLWYVYRLNTQAWVACATKEADLSLCYSTRQTAEAALASQPPAGGRGNG